MRSFQKRLLFIAKSMLWSLLLYAIFMLAFNWDDVSNKVRGINPITVVNNLPSGNTVTRSATVAPSISAQAGIVNFVENILSIIDNIVN